MLDCLNSSDNDYNYYLYHELIYRSKDFIFRLNRNGLRDLAMNFSPQLLIKPKL